MDALSAAVHLSSTSERCTLNHIRNSVTSLPLNESESDPKNIRPRPSQFSFALCSIGMDPALELYRHIRQSVEDRGIEAVRRIRCLCLATGRAPRNPIHRMALDAFLNLSATQQDGCNCFYCYSVSLLMVGDGSNVQQLIQLVQRCYREDLAKHVAGRSPGASLQTLCEEFCERAVADIAVLDGLAEQQVEQDAEMQRAYVEAILSDGPRWGNAMHSALAMFYKHSDLPSFAETFQALFHRVRFELLHVLRRARGPPDAESCAVCDLLNIFVHPAGAIDANNPYLLAVMNSVEQVGELADKCIVLKIRQNTALRVAGNSHEDAKMFARACEAILSAKNSVLSPDELHTALNVHREKTQPALECAFEDAEIVMDPDVKSGHTHRFIWKFKIMKIGGEDAHVATHGHEVQVRDFEFMMRCVGAQAARIMNIMNSSAPKLSEQCAKDNRERNRYNECVVSIIRDLGSVGRPHQKDEKQAREMEEMARRLSTLQVMQKTCKEDFMKKRPLETTGSHHSHATSVSKKRFQQREDADQYTTENCSARTFRSDQGLCSSTQIALVVEAKIIEAICIGSRVCLPHEQTLKKLAHQHAFEVVEMIDKCILLSIKHQTMLKRTGEAAEQDAALFGRVCEAVMSSADSPLSDQELHRALNVSRQDQPNLQCSFADTKITIADTASEHDTYGFIWRFKILKVGDLEAHVSAHGDKITARDFEFVMRCIGAQAARIIGMMQLPEASLTATCRTPSTDRDAYNASIASVLAEFGRTECVSANTDTAASAVDASGVDAQPLTNVVEEASI
eukprot:m.793621 g.793621  ORF g.793621 m.793621 type:complete len:795 (-) comp23336_c2_seq32:989-3373(-)